MSSGTIRRSLAGAALIIALLSPSLTQEEPASAREAASPTMREFAERVRLSGLFYLSYEHGNSGGDDFSEFTVDRAYLTAQAKILPYLSARLTLDTSQDMEGDGRGDLEMRIKYAYASFALGDWGLLTDLNLEAGVVHVAWLDFEQSVNGYRMRDRMFVERSGLFNSGDFGLTLLGGFGPSLGEEFRRQINDKYDARHGSFAFGIYNGAGYDGDERNNDKVAELRLSYRPLPDLLPGLQLSGLAIVGDGNVADEGNVEPPEWRTYNVFVSYEHRRGVVTAQRVLGRGDQDGDFVEPGDPSTGTDYEGYAFFAEWRLDEHWRLIGGYDDFVRTITGEDVGFERVFGGVGYALGRGNIILVDYDRREWDDQRPEPVDDRAQLTLQVKF